MPEPLGPGLGPPGPGEFEFDGLGLVELLGPFGPLGPSGPPGVPEPLGEWLAFAPRGGSTGALPEKVLVRQLVIAAKAAMSAAEKNTIFLLKMTFMNSLLGPFSRIIRFIGP